MFDGYGDLYSDGPPETISFDTETPVENTPTQSSKIKIQLTIGDSNFAANGPRDAMLSMLDQFIATTKAGYLAADKKAALTKETPY